jgi:lysophospholipase L1-like esterase
MRSVLLLGDSHTFGPYGQELERLFKADGWTVTRVGWVGARADNYLKGTHEKIGLGGTGDWSSAKGRRYDVAVVTLGTNDAALLPAGGDAAPAAAKILELVNGLDAGATWWVGPPAFEAGIAKSYNKAFKTDDLNARADRLWKAGSPLFSRAIDPRAATRPFVSSSDIHFSPKGGKAWARSVFDAVSSPGMELSTTSTGPGTGLVVAVLALGALTWWLFKRRRA